MANSVAKFKTVKWAIPVIAVFVILGTYSGVFALAALLMSVLVIGFSDQEDTMCLLFFLLPYANIFKTSPGSQSFFTYLVMFYVLYKAITKKRIDKTFLVALLIMSVLLLAQSYSSFNAMRTIKFIVNFLLIYAAMRINVDKSHRNVFLFYIFGLVSSSFATLALSDHLVTYIGVKDLGLANDWLVRFSGMYGDPNYFSVNVIVSLCLIVIMWHKKEINAFLALALMGCLVYFSIITYSKSAFLMLAFPMMLFVYSSIKNKKYVVSLFFLVVFIVLIILAFSGKIPALSMVLSRFEAGGDDLTTGRSQLWSNYLSFLGNNPLKMIFGSGTGASLVEGMGAHNTYIDFLYYLGFFGIFCFILVIACIPKPLTAIKRRNFLNYGIISVCFIMYFFLSELFYIDLPFHIILAFYAMYMSMEEVDTGKE